MGVDSAIVRAVQIHQTPVEESRAIGSMAVRAMWLAAGFAIGLLGSVLAAEALGFPILSR
ncbi:MAG TPA: hypothetical protein VHC22_04425 [Pirellulales bacterium]|nr:hypothetical protein [Pirellulales bacterium]